MSRQIIKTRSQRPYIIARIVIAAIVVIIVLIAIAYAVAERRARTHDVTQATRIHAALQELPFTRRKPQSPAHIIFEGVTACKCSFAANLSG